MPELIDIRDRHGVLTGEVMQRAQVHKSELWHGVVLVWVYDSQGRILMQLRAGYLNAFPERWDISVAGHMTATEKPLQTAKRQLAEELGIYVDESQLEYVEELTDQYELSSGKMHRAYCYIYTVKHEGAVQDLKVQASKILDVHWITAQELRGALQNPATANQYTGRDKRIYDIILNKVSGT